MLKLKPLLLAVMLASPGVAERTQTLDLSGSGYAFEGWGTSLAWWTQQVGDWPDERLDPLIAAICDPDTGLGLSVFRYNVGGGEHPDHHHMRRGGDVPGFRAEADAPLDHDADPLQRRVLKKLIARAERPILEAFSNSPPYWMTRSGCVSGGEGGEPNLPDDRVEDFAAYLADVVALYRDRHGVVFRTIDPFNEPNQPWWSAGGTQEGCRIDPPQQERILHALDAALRARGLPTAIAANDAHDLDLALRDLSRYQPETLARVGQINTHTYRGGRRRELREFAAAEEKRLWQSESGPMDLDARGREPVLLAMMGRVALDLNELRPAAWVMWQVIDDSLSWGCFYVSDRRRGFRPTANFGLYAQFTRAIRPGDTVVPTDDPSVVACLSADRSTAELVVVNAEPTAESWQLRIGGFARGATTARATESSVHAAFTPIEVNQQADSLRFEASPYSVTRVTLEGVSE